MHSMMWPPIWQLDDPDEGDTEEVPSVPDPPKCADCKGTGKYVGLNEVEDCETCLGSGY